MHWCRVLSNNFPPMQPEYQFNLNRIHLLETVKTNLTKQVIIDVQPQFINEDFIHFIDNNVKNNPGKSSIKFNLKDIRTNYKISMYSLEKGFTMNDEMAIFLNENPDIEVSVMTN